MAEVYKSDKDVKLNIPTVPPNSITHTSAGPVPPSTGIEDTDSIQFFMASVMWGTTWDRLLLAKTN